MVENQKIKAKIGFEADFKELEKLLSTIKRTIEKRLKTNVKVNVELNPKGYKSIQRLKEEVSKKVKIPVEFEQRGKIPKINEIPKFTIGGVFEKVKEILNKIPKIVPNNFIQKVFGKNTKRKVSSAKEASPEPEQEEKKSKSDNTSKSEKEGILGKVKGILGKVPNVVPKGFVEEVFNTVGKFQELKTTLSNSLGGDAEASALMEIIKETAREADLGIDETGAAFSELINNGLKPTKEEMLQFNNMAKAQKKDLGQWISAVTDAVKGENEGLKKFGVTAKDAGDSWIYTFNGVSTKVKKNEKDIYNYMAGLGRLPGVMDAAEKSSKDFNSIMDGISDTITNTKITFFEKIVQCLSPVLTVVQNLLESFQKWAEENSELAGIIGTVIVVLSGLSAVAAGLSAILGAISLPVILVIGVIAILTAVIMDLWNGFSTGNSVIADIISGFLNWIGISVTAQEVIDGIRYVFEMLTIYVTEFVVPVLQAVIGYLIDYFMAIFQGFMDFIGIGIEIFVALFTGNIPKAAEGFIMLKNAALNVFGRMTIGALEAVKAILGAFRGLMEKLSDLPVVGKYIKGGIALLNGHMDHIEVKVRKENENVEQRDKEINEYLNRKKSQKGPKKDKPKKEKVDPFRNMNSNIGNNFGTNRSKNRNTDNGRKEKDDKTKEENRIIVSAIESLQDILKKTGYDITSEIKRANLFEAKRAAILESQKKTGIMEMFKDIKDRYIQNKTTNNLEIILNGNKISANGINENTRIKDLYQIQNAKKGG